MLKKSLALLLILLMLVPFATSCKKNGAGDSESNGGDVSESQGQSESQGGSNRYEQYDVIDAVGERDYGGYNITVAHVGHAHFADEISPKRITGDLVSDSLYKRDRTIEKRLNVKMNTYVADGSGVYRLGEAVREGVSSGLHPFDIMINPLYTACSFITEGLYYDMNTLEDVDFDQVYWGKFANDSMEIGGVQYVATGAIALNYYRFIFATIVNDRILNETTGEVPDLIQVVKDDKWTLEYQTALANKYYADQGAAGKDEDDILGFYGSAQGIVNIYCDPYLSASGVSILGKDAEGYLTVDFDLNRASSAVSAVSDLLTAPGSLVSTTTSDNLPDMFGNGNVLMTTLRFMEIGYDAVKNMNDTYTILPMPMLNEDQEDYYSTLHDSASGVAIPITLEEKNLQMIGAVVEVMAAESYRMVTPAYYENVLKTRYVANPDNWEIVDMIMTNAVLDPITPFTNSLKIDGATPIFRWRLTCTDAVNSGGNLTVSSYFSDAYLDQLSAALNGTSGLNTYYKGINAN